MNPLNQVRNLAGQAQDQLKGAAQSLFDRARRLSTDVDAWEQDAERLRQGLRQSLPLFEAWLDGVDALVASLRRQVPRSSRRMGPPRGLPVSRRMASVARTVPHSLAAGLQRVDVLRDQAGPTLDLLLHRARPILFDAERRMTDAQRIEQQGQAMKQLAEAIVQEARNPGGLAQQPLAREALAQAERTLRQLAARMPIVVLCVLILAIVLFSMVDCAQRQAQWLARIRMPMVELMALILVCIAVALVDFCLRLALRAGDAPAMERLSTALDQLEDAATEARRQYRQGLARLG